jgi:hypothetical protein
MGCGFSAVSAWIAVRVVAVVCLIAFRLPGAVLLNHDDGTSWWSGPRRWSIAVVAAARDRAGAWYRWCGSDR